MQMAARPLKDRASRETIEEWWEYADRRGWLEGHGAGHWGLSSIGRSDIRELRQSISGPDPADWAKALMRWALPAGAIGAAVLLSDKDLTIGLAIVIISAIIVVALLLAALITRFLDPPLERWIARRACDWLDGRRVRWWILEHSAVEGEVRRLYEANEPPEASVRHDG